MDSSGSLTRGEVAASITRFYEAMSTLNVEVREVMNHERRRKLDIAISHRARLTLTPGNGMKSKGSISVFLGLAVGVSLSYYRKIHSEWSVQY